MPIQKQELQRILLQSFPNAEIILEDIAGDEDHYSLIIKDSSFSNLSIMQQHKLVKSSLKDVLDKKLHALTIKTIPC
ncbi:MAG: BolA/IbaG family iron-sulfur metabolism protein [Rickettsiaceae bacterium]|nr:BolA/IbaG family iron-sulfur metabolism protein [Rickettsiaceae bacterium]